MHVIICGGRDYHLTPEDYQWLEVLHTQWDLTLVIHGAARGADTEAAQWAQQAGIPTQAYPAAWGRHGAGAGPIRNNQMLRHLRETAAPSACAVIAFPGGRGTADMIRRAEAAGVPVWRRETP